MGFGRKVGAWGVHLILGAVACAGPAVPDAENAGAEHTGPQAAWRPGDMSEPKTEKSVGGPCPDAPDPSDVVTQSLLVEQRASEMNDFLRGLGRPLEPSAPFSVEGARRWRQRVGQPWADAQMAQVFEFEKTLSELPEGTYAKARMTVSVAAVWQYLSERRPRIPKSAERDYLVRLAYLQEWALLEGEPLHVHAARWVDRARDEASRWGMFQIGVERFWLSKNAGDFVREPFPAQAEQPKHEHAPAGLPSSVVRELRAPGWPASAEDVLQLGQSGMTPRQLECALRFAQEDQAGSTRSVRETLGRYYATRALLFQDQRAATTARRFLSESASPEAIVDLALVQIIDWNGTEAAADFKESFNRLPEGHLARRRLWVNLVRTPFLPGAGDFGPPVEDLPEGERPTRSFEPTEGTRRFGPPAQAFSWWTSSSESQTDKPGRLEGVRVDLSDGGHLMIPYGDYGLDTCAMVHVGRDGQRDPHRPPDIQKKCAGRWAKEEAERRGE